MKHVYIILLYLTFMNGSGVFAQENRRVNREVKNIPDSLVVNPKYSTGMEVGTSFMTNLKNGYGFETYFSPNLSYFPSESFQLNFSTTLGSVNYHNMTLFDYFNRTQVFSGIAHYLGLSGSGTYQVNKRIYFSSGGFVERQPDFGPVGNKYENPLNFGGSLLVGYKFSDKVSIQAGFGIRKYNDPWNQNPFLFNQGIIP